MKKEQQFPDTIKSCAIAFLCVCEFRMAKEDLAAWAQDRLSPDEFLDTNQVLLDVIENHGVSTELNEEGEMPHKADYIFRAAHELTYELNRKKHTIEVVEVNGYSLADLQSSINDICSQWHSAKIDTNQAKALARKCCATFLINE